MYIMKQNNDAIVGLNKMLNTVDNIVVDQCFGIDGPHEVKMVELVLSHPGHSLDIWQVFNCMKHILSHSLCYTFWRKHLRN